MLRHYYISITREVHGACCCESMDPQDSADLLDSRMGVGDMVAVEALMFMNKNRWNTRTSNPVQFRPLTPTSDFSEDDSVSAEVLRRSPMVSSRPT